MTALMIGMFQLLEMGISLGMKEVLLTEFPGTFLVFY